MLRISSWLRECRRLLGRPRRRCRPVSRKLSRRRPLLLEMLPDRLLPSADPVLTLIGASQAVEGAPYALTLGPVVDADPNHVVTQYVIHWGDGTSSTYTPATLPADRVVTHTYADGVDAAAQISVDLYQQAGAFFDPTFGGGPFRSNLGGNETGHDVVQDPTTGNVIVLGSVDGVTSFIRYRADGALDTTFGANGRVAFDNAVGLSGNTHALAIDSAGRILVGGQLGNDWAVARYLADGSRDATFGSNGVARIFLSTQPKTLYALAVDAQDRIYLTGEAIYPVTNSWDLQLARLTANGQLDPSFATTPIHIGSPNRGTAIAVDAATGNVFVVNSTNLGALLHRFTPTGTLDTSFGAGGLAYITTPFGMPNYDLIVDGAGGLLVSGAAFVNGRYHFAVARYGPEGALDTAFGANGVLSVNLGGFTEVVRGLALDAQGRALLVGFSTPGTNGPDIELARVLYNSDGPYLSLAGKTITVANAAPTVTLAGPSGDVLQGASVVFQGGFTDPGQAADGPYTYTWSVSSSNGQVIAPVSGTLAAPGATPDFGFTLTAGGAYTVSLTVTDKDGASSTQQVVLNGIGLTLTGAASGDEGSPYALTLGPVVDGDPKHVVSTYVVHWGDGTTSTHAAASLPVDRTVYHTYANGSAATAATQITVDLVEAALVLDAGFGAAGQVVRDFGGLDSAYSVALDPTNGKHIVLGSINGTLSFARFRPDGALDTSFGSGGVVPYVSTMGTYGYALAIDSAGRMFVGGMTNTATTGSDYAVTRFLANGSVDASFGSNGTASFHLGSSVESVFDLTLDAQGRILLTGQAQASASNRAMVLLRLTAAGALDPTFNTIIQNVNGYDLGRAVAVDPATGNILVLASAGTQYSLFRFLPDGARDASFGSNGRRALPGVTGNSLAIDASGRILVGLAAGSDFRVARYRADGTADAAFGSNGVFTFDLGSGSEDANNLTLDAQGRLVLAGYSVGANPNVALVRAVAIDDGPYLAVAAKTIAVHNVAPTAAITSGPTTSNEGGSVTFGGGFTDPALTADAAYSYTWTVTASNGQTVPPLTGATAATGAVPSFTFTPNDNGSYTVQFVVTDRDGASSTATQTLTVGNIAPTATITSGPASSAEGAAVVFSGAFTDPGTQDAPFQYAWSVLASNGQAVADLTGMGTVADFSFMPADNGTYTVRLVVTDKDGAASAAAERVLTVGNVAPIAGISAGPTASLEGDAVTFAGSFTDPGATADAAYRFTWTVTASNGQVVTPLSGAAGAPGVVPDLTFTPHDNGSYTVSLTVTDKDGATSQAQQVLIVGNLPPTAAITAGPTAGLEGDAVTFQGAFADPAGMQDSPFQYAWSVVASNGQAVAGLAGAGAVADYTFTPDDNGTYTVRLIVTDKDGATSAPVEQVLTVANVTPRATITAGPTTSREGDAVTFQGAFTDPAGPRDADYTYAWSVVASNGQAVAGLTGTGTVADYAFTPADDGTYTVRLVVTDKDGAASIAAERVLTVGNVAPTAMIASGPATSLEGDAVTFMGSFTDPGAAADAAYTYTWTVTASNGQVVTPAPGTAAAPGAVPAFSFSPHDNGTYTVQLVVTDKDGAASSATVLLTVSNAPPIATIVSGPTASGEGDVVTFQGAFTDPAGTHDSPCQYAWSVLASNGQTVAGLTGTGMVADYAFTPADDGTYTVRLVVTDKDGAASIAAERVLTVGNVAPTATIASGPTASREGAAVTFQGAFTDPAGALDGPYEYVWSVVASNSQAVADLHGAGPVADFAFTPADDGVYVVRLVVMDKDGAASTAERILTVANVPPAAVIFGGAALGLAGNSMAFSGGFTDPAQALDGAFTYTWTVTANNGQAATVFTAVQSAPGLVPTFHFTPSAAGVYTVRLVVQDKDGGVSAAAQATLTVPGFATIAERLIAAGSSNLALGSPIGGVNLPSPRSVSSANAPAQGIGGSEGMSLIAGWVGQGADAAAPAGGVVVLLEREANGVFAQVGTTVTGADGGFTFTQLPPATYRLRLAAGPGQPAGLVIKDVRAQRVHCLPPGRVQADARRDDAEPPARDLTAFDQAFTELAEAEEPANAPRPWQELPAPPWEPVHGLDAIAVASLAGWRALQALGQRGLRRCFSSQCRV